MKWNKTSTDWEPEYDFGYTRLDYGETASAVPLDSGIEKWCNNTGTTTPAPAPSPVSFDIVNDSMNIDEATGEQLTESYNFNLMPVDPQEEFQEY